MTSWSWKSYFGIGRGGGGGKCDDRGQTNGALRSSQNALHDLDHSLAASHGHWRGALCHFESGPAQRAFVRTQHVAGSHEGTCRVHGVALVVRVGIREGTWQAHVEFVAAAVVGCPFREEWVD